MALAVAALAPHLGAEVGTPPPAPAIAPGDLQFFEARIRPIFADRCYKCHSRTADKIKGCPILEL